MSKRQCVAAILAAYIMDDSSDEEDNNETVTSKRKRVWRKEWVGRREKEGFCSKLQVELNNEEPTLFTNFLRMTSADFENLLNLVKPHIEKADTVMRASIPASTRLTLTLRYLATGDSFMSLQYLFRIPQPTISTIIPEVVDAIYKVLVDDYIQVKCHIVLFVSL